MAWLGPDIPAVMADLMRQHDVDLSKKNIPVATSLQYLYAAWNGYHDTGVLDASVGADEVHAVAGGWFFERGYPEIAAAWNTGEGEGDFASWPITYHAPA